MATAAGRRDRWLWIFFLFLRRGLVSSGIMRDGRERGRKEDRGQRWKRDCLCFVVVVGFFFLPIPAGGKCLSKTSETIAEVKVTQIKNSLSAEREVSWGCPESGRVQGPCHYSPRLQQALLHGFFFRCRIIIIIILAPTK